MCKEIFDVDIVSDANVKSIDIRICNMQSGFIVCGWIEKDFMSVGSQWMYDIMFLELCLLYTLDALNTSS